MIKGRLDRINKWYVRGWCFDTESPTTPLTISIYKNGKKTIEGPANILRKALVEKNLHPTGKCEFNVYFGDKCTLLDGDKISVKYNQKQLANSPIVFEKTEKLLANKKDILIVGLGKSGTTALAHAIKEKNQNSVLHLEPKGGKGLGNINLHKTLQKNSSKPIITKSLYFTDHEIDFGKLDQIYGKKIWILRDPRDRMISLFLYWWYHKHNPDKDKFVQVIKLLKEKEKSPNNVSFLNLWNIIFPSQTVKKMFIKERNSINNILSNLSDNWFLLKYEDFVSGNLKSLEDYLETSVVKNVQITGNLSRVARSKTSGNWVNWFTEEDVIFFKPIFDPLLHKFGYDTQWKLSPNPVINPEKSSLYVEKLFNKQLT